MQTTTTNETQVNQAEKQQWIVTDEPGTVHGRVRSPHYAGALHLAKQLWPELDPLYVWPWMEATHQQRHDAKAHRLYDAGTIGRMAAMANVMKRLAGGAF